MTIIIDGKTNAARGSLYAPRIQRSGELCPAPPYTIVAVAESAGLLAADFAVPLTLIAPTDTRWTVLSIATTVAMQVTAFDGDVRCRVYVDAQDPATLVADLTIAAGGPPIEAGWDSNSYPAADPAIFTLLSDGLPHIFYIYLWKLGAGVGATIDTLSFVEGVGSDQPAGMTEVLTLDGTRGLVTVSGEFNCALPGGFSSLYAYITSPKGGTYGEDVITVGPTAGPQPLSLVEGGGNWFNARPVHTLGSIGISLFANGLGDTGLVEYIRIIWSDSE